MALRFLEKFLHSCVWVFHIKKTVFREMIICGFSTLNVKALGLFETSIPKTAVFFPFNGILCGLAIESIVKYPTKGSDHLLCSLVSTDEITESISVEHCSKQFAHPRRCQHAVYTVQGVSQIGCLH
jgi:hypothetical protein